jgi:regulator of protease activity HflC (stomatin/prohibitin superfamily)
VSDAIAHGEVQAINYFVAQRYLQAFEKLAVAPNQKLLIVPSEMSGVLGTLAGIAELARGGAGTPPPAERPQPWGNPG